jgi:hypothetical protein
MSLGRGSQTNQPRTHSIHYKECTRKLAYTLHIAALHKMISEKEYREAAPFVLLLMYTGYTHEHRQTRDKQMGTNSEHTK